MSAEGPGVLVVWESKTGTTRAFADRAGKAFEAAGWKVTLVEAGAAQDRDLEAADLVVFGTWCDSNQPARKTRALWAKPLKLKRAAAFVTHATYEAGEEYEEWAAGCQTAWQAFAGRAVAEDAGYFHGRAGASPSIRLFIRLTVFHNGPGWETFRQDLDDQPVPATWERFDRFVGGLAGAPASLASLLWDLLDRRDFPALVPLFAPGATVTLANTGERMDPQAYAQFNAGYPGVWRVNEVSTVTSGTEAVSVARVTEASGAGDHFVTAWLDTAAGRITSSTEYWGENGPPPAWRAAGPAPAPWAIAEVTEPADRSAWVREVLESLPEWFGQPASLEEYVRDAAGLPVFGARDASGQRVGFFCLKVHHGTTGDLYVLGIKPEAHRQGLGRALWAASEAWFRQQGCTQVIVKTLDASARSEAYDRTRAFYRALGFEPLVTLPELWDAANPCLLMLKRW